MPHRRTLLIVDNSADPYSELCAELDKEGIDSVFIQKGQEALDRLKTCSDDIVILNTHLPDISGLDVLSTLRQSSTPIEVPTIVISDDGFDDTVAQALKHGANDYIEWPIRPVATKARIQAYVEMKRAGEEIVRREERLALALKGTNEVLWDWNLIDNTVYFSPHWETMLNFEEGELGTSIEAWLDRISPEDKASFLNHLDNHIDGVTPYFDHQYRMVNRNGQNRWVHSRGLALRDEQQKAIRIVGCHTDITNYVAQNSLTGLPNRVFFLDRLETEFARLKRSSEHSFAVMYLDLDDFKVIHDGLSFAEGNQLVVEIGERIQSNLRITDTVSHYTLSHFSDDKFLILLVDIKDKMDALRTARRVQESLVNPFYINQQDIYIRVSIGVAIGSTEYEKPDDIIRDASIAMTRAKLKGKGRTEVFDKTMQHVASQRLALEQKFRKALKEHEFQVYYQPIVCLHTGKIIEFEALVRWDHPEDGMIMPGDFIPQAEELGLIVEIDRWVLLQACLQLKIWQEKNSQAADLQIAINLSSQEFDRTDLVDFIRQTLHTTGVSAKNLHLELTETTLIQHTAEVDSALKELNKLGINLSLDDFGTGYSSLSYLHQFPTDVMKIDRCFVSKVSDDPKSAKIVKAATVLAHNLGMKVVAEGIETERQLKLLQTMYCDLGQGYHFSKPVPAHTAYELLDQKPFAV